MGGHGSGGKRKGCGRKKKTPRTADEMEAAEAKRLQAEQLKANSAARQHLVYQKSEERRKQQNDEEAEKTRKLIAAVAQEVSPINRTDGSTIADEEDDDYGSDYEFDGDDDQESEGEDDGEPDDKKTMCRQRIKPHKDTPLFKYTTSIAESNV
jgi:hypothetical protein